MLITENTVPDRFGGGWEGQWGFSQVDIRVCFKQPGRVGNHQTAGDQAQNPLHLLQGFRWLPRSPRPAKQAQRAGGSGRAWAQPCPQTLPGQHRHPGPQGGSASAPRPGHTGTQCQPRKPEGQDHTLGGAALHGAVTGASPKPLVASTASPPQGLIGGGLQPHRAWSG